jgi:hypothetical protein
MLWILLFIFPQLFLMISIHAAVMKPTLILFLLFYSFSFSQSIDTLKNDSLLVIPDTLTTVPDSLIMQDTTGIVSTEKVLARVDTLVPRMQSPLFNQSIFLNRYEFTRHDYRYAGDIVNLMPFTFLLDRGFIGAPNSLMLYGFGSRSTSYLSDGILLNDRMIFEYDLNNFQSELIDSVEIIPLPRSMLYGAYMNPAAVNLITKDFLSLAPYTRIKYYEGAFGEAFFDGIFNAMLFDNFNLFVDVTNRKFDSSYTNTDYGIWQGTVKGKYFFSNKLNVIGSYNLVDSKSGHNLGVGVDSINRSGASFNDIFYDPISAPVSAPFLRKNIKEHNFSLRFLGEFFPDFKTDLTFYSRFYQFQWINEIASDFSISQRKIYTNGIHLKQSAKYGLAEVDLIAAYENSKIKIFVADSYYSGGGDRVISAISLSPIFTLSLLNDKLKPSVFMRIVNDDYLQTRRGYGFDATYQLNDAVKFYGGYSSFEQFKDNYFNSAEIGAEVIYLPLELGIRLISRDEYYHTSGLRFVESFDFSPALNGIDVSLSAYLWKIKLEAKAQLYDYGREKVWVYELPEQIFSGGLYFKDLLFNENLDLKTGFYFKFFGERNFNPLSNGTCK